ncbi:CRISPR-associated endonuclease Cas1 [Actinosynnema sp. NPDC050436]|uniref:CRISPR-associated endonuclease Cas1 n=1 Tax=Actinosynnema sp. NPDC050436 TaxID=3155659 RepID=UPI0033FC7595
MAMLGDHLKSRSHGSLERRWHLFEMIAAPVPHDLASPGGTGADSRSLSMAPGTTRSSTLSHIRSLRDGASLPTSADDNRLRRCPLRSAVLPISRRPVQGALEQVSLDLYIGYLHGVRAGEPSLALDRMEEMRPLLGDRLVLTLLNRRQILDRHTEALPGGAVQLADDGRRTFLEHWSTARERPWPHTALGRDVPAALVPLVQARLLARHLRGTTDTYTPWTMA